MAADSRYDVRRGLTHAGEGLAVAATLGGVLGGIYVTFTGRPQFHRHVIASSLTLGSLAAVYLGSRQVLIAAQMRDSAPVSVLAGFYSSAALSYAVGVRRARILPWALLTGAAGGLAHVAYDQAQLSKRAYLHALPADREPELSDWIGWVVTPASRPEWTHRLGAQIDWLFFGSDIIEVRRRLAERKGRREAREF